ncbi:deoxyribodipyrimidine photo-lyase [Vibrio fluvialis]|nr:deoxyribodipyrimidine photo-lyase [Vibrio fluvialis]HDM8034007.1 deoxyribodipyrimidine photo-lyase [Vibrio fluvialis clinical-1]EKO3419971.1 deoxyribodipyrimidine photo-lyase [Vibrio fluvialis]EKO3520267.1 deoxyribodipyrimidine photo-lyase [Vibrio fluvialis]EKO3527145.1 deoxyribodipyrimidine photo-lyase [Vibrio fluvialis]
MKLVWLRRDLRAVDNAALNEALISGEPVCALFVATPQQWQQHDLAPIQADLIYRRLFALQEELSALNVPLLYREVATFADSVDAVQQVAVASGANQVLANRDYELNEQKRDALAAERLQQQGIDWHSFNDKCVMAPGSVLNKQGEYFKVFTPFKRAWLTQFTPPVIRASRAAPEHALPDDLQALVWNAAQPFTHPRISSELWPVDFDTLRRRLRAFCQEQLDDYKQQRDFPAKAGTSALSPYLAIGALSPRQCIARVYAETEMGILSEGAQTWLSELIWREFYQHLLVFEPKLSKSKDFLEWGSRLEWWQDEAKFSRWCEGKTGYPIVDAAMRQLNKTGWMHNRLRMIVASFLTKDLHIDWRWGERYFMQQLVDGDYAANNGGWQWCASTGCDGQPYFRIFNPITQGEKFDPSGSFIRQWVPELANVSEAHIHAPWKWSGVNSLLYPQPIVDHKAEREVTLRLYKEAKDNVEHVA